MNDSRITALKRLSAYLADCSCALKAVSSSKLHTISHETDALLVHQLTVQFCQSIRTMLMNRQALPFHELPNANLAEAYSIKNLLTAKLPKLEQRLIINKTPGSSLKVCQLMMANISLIERLLNMRKQDKEINGIVDSIVARNNVAIDEILQIDQPPVIRSAR